MNFGGYLHISGILYEVAKEYCGDDWEIIIQPIRGVMLFRISWCRNLDGEHIKHYQIGVTENDSMIECILKGTLTKAAFKNLYEDEVIPI